MLEIEISVTDTAELIGKDSAVRLVDVRTPEEYAIAHIENCPLVDENLVQTILNTWPKDTRIVTVCHHGMRSLAAAEFFRAKGFPNTQSMRGGIDAWSRLIDSGIPRY